MYIMLTMGHYLTSSIVLIYRPNLPAAVARAISTLRAEPAWDALEGLGPVLILGAQSPYLVIGATKKWSQLTGFLMSDTIAKDLSFMEGAQSNKALFRQVCAEVCRGYAAHACLTHYRRDGSPFVNSVHGFPVFDGNHCLGVELDASVELLEDTSTCFSEITATTTVGASTVLHEEDDDADRTLHKGGQGTNDNTSDSFSSSVSVGVHLEPRRTAREIVNPLCGKGAQHRSNGSLADKSIESGGAAVGRKSPLLGSGIFDPRENNGKVAFIVLQFSVIVDTRGTSSATK